MGHKWNHHRLSEETILMNRFRPLVRWIRHKRCQGKGQEDGRHRPRWGGNTHNWLRISECYTLPGLQKKKVPHAWKLWTSSEKQRRINSEYEPTKAMICLRKHASKRLRDPANDPQVRLQFIGHDTFNFGPWFPVKPISRLEYIFPALWTGEYMGQYH